MLSLIYTCEYAYIYHAYVYRKSLFLLLCCHTKRVSGIHSGFGYPRVRFLGRIITRIDVRCGFGFWFRVRVHRDSTRSESTPLPSLAMMSPYVSSDWTRLLRVRSLSAPLTGTHDRTRRSKRGLRSAPRVTCSPPFLHRVDPFQLQTLLLCKCANTTMCMCVSIFTIIFQRISHSTCHTTQSRRRCKVRSLEWH